MRQLCFTEEIYFAVSEIRPLFVLVRSSSVNWPTRSAMASCALSTSSRCASTPRIFVSPDTAKVRNSSSFARNDQEFRFWLGPGSARALADPGEMPEAHEAASATGS
jgi:hypothetical protein